MGCLRSRSDSSLLARNERRARSKREQRRLSERYRIPSANFIVATLHRRDCSLKFDLSSDETSATGSHQSFAHFDSPGHCKSMLPGFCFSSGFSAFFRFATCQVAAGRQGTGLAGGKDHFREFPHISSFFRFENVHFDISRYNS